MWLNEAFAEYTSNIASHYIDPTIHTWERFYVEETQWVMYEDMDTSQHWAMTDPVTTRCGPGLPCVSILRDDIERKFGDFTYNKGGSVLRMVDQILTEPAFTAGLTTYLAAFAYSTTTEEDLFLHLGAAALEAGVWPQAGGPRGSLGETLATWTRQAGLPLVTASRECGGATGDCSVTFSQQWLTWRPQGEVRRGGEEASRAGEAVGHPSHLLHRRSRSHGHRAAPGPPASSLPTVVARPGCWPRDRLT
jgi:aminopeptidase N